MSDDRTNALEALNAAPAGTPAGSFFGGSLSAIPRGLADAGAQFVMQNAEMLPRNAGQGMTEQQYQEPAQTDDEYQKGLKDTQNELGNYLRPNPYTTGVVGNTLFGVSDVGARAAIGTALGGPVGAAALVGGSTGQQADIEAQAQGVDSGTALKMGVASGAFNAAALGIPMSFGGSLPVKLLTGAAVNTALQQGGQQYTSQILDKAGYSTMAAQYRQTDAATIASDVVLGAFFGAHHAGGEPAPEPSIAAVDAATTAQADARYQTEAAPGAAVNAAGIQAHSEAMDTARTQLLNDEPVQLGNTLKDAEYLPMPDPSNRAQAVSALMDAGYVPDTSTPRVPDEVIAQRMTERLGDYDQARTDYSAIPETDNGKVLSTDIARELSPDYMEDRSRSAATHEPASAFTKAMYADALQQDPKEGEEPNVMFTAGGTGAGKTTSLDSIPELKAAKDSAQIVYDTNMNKFDSADTKIKQALAANKDVQIVYTYRHPLDAFVNGALSRAQSQAKKFGTGRTVPISEHLSTHEGSFKTINELAAKYKDDPRVKIDVVDNSHGKNSQRSVSLDSVKYPEDTDLKENLTKAVLDELQQGKISQETARGFLGEDADARLAGDTSASGDSSGASNRSEGEPQRNATAAETYAGKTGTGDEVEGSGRQAGEGNGRESSSQHEGSGAGVQQASPEEVRAGSIAGEKPDLAITYADENGNEVTETAAQALARNDEESSNIQRMADAVRAAVSCAMRFGE